MNLVPTARKLTDINGVLGHYRYPARHICYASRKRSAFAISYFLYEHYGRLYWQLFDPARPALSNVEN